LGAMYNMKTFCCGLSLKHGTIITGVVQSILSFVILILSAAYAENPHELLDLSDPSIVPDTTVLKTILVIIASAGAIHCTFSILLIFGAETNRPVLLLPWLTFGPMCFMAYLLGTLIAIAHHSTVNVAIFITAHIIVAISLLLLGCYKFFTVLNYYKHLRSLNF